MTPEQRAEFLKSDDSMTSAHSDSANEGQTQAPNVDDEVELHFIAFVQKDGVLYEFDGATDFPINHGEANSENFLEVSFRENLKELKFLIKFLNLILIYNRKVQRLYAN